jgi:hypothetical protein
LLYGYFVAIENRKWNRAVSLLVAISALKFWGIIFVLVLVAKSKYRHAIIAVCSTTALTVSLLIPFNGPLKNSILVMLQSVTDREYGNQVSRYAYSIQGLARRSFCYLNDEVSCNLVSRKSDWVATFYFSLIIIFVLSVFSVLIVKRSSQTPHVWMLSVTAIGFLGVPEAPIYQLSLIAAPIAAVLSIENYNFGRNWMWTTRALLVTIVVSSTPLTLWSNQPNRFGTASPDGSDFIFRSDQWLIPIFWVVTIFVATIEMTIRGRNEKFNLFSGLEVEKAQS